MKALALLLLLLTACQCSARIVVDSCQEQADHPAVRCG